MNELAGAVLVLLLVVIWQQFRAGTLGQWMRAKFLNDPGPK